jgi:hypothetical protein
MKKTIGSYLKLAETLDVLLERLIRPKKGAIALRQDQAKRQLTQRQGSMKTTHFGSTISIDTGLTGTWKRFLPLMNQSASAKRMTKPMTGPP